jgi:uncharacterized protein (DUF1786 family)
MKAASFDVGAGTIDFLLYDVNKNIENCVKMVLPSPQKVYAEKIKEITGKQIPVYMNGYTIGGGSITGAIKKHIEKGYAVYMTTEAAYSIRNNLSEVKDMGIHLVKEKPNEFIGESIFLDEILLNAFESTLNNFSETIHDVDAILISVKDHGASPTRVSNRAFRIKKFKEILSNKNDLNSFLFHEKQIPEYFFRMKSAVKASKELLPNTDVYLMDTSISALIGCLWDERVHGREPVLVVNVGNGHTIAAVIFEKRVLGFFEHHTGKLTGHKLVGLMVSLSDGTLTHEEVFLDGGHGTVILGEMPGFSNLNTIAVTGPRRDILKGTSIEYVQATPGGDTMMSGTIGLIQSYLDVI